MFKTEIITSPIAFAALEVEWQNLHAACDGGIFVHHGFLQSWLETYGTKVNLHVVTLRAGGHLIAVLPLCDAGPRFAMVPIGEGRAGVAQWLIHPKLSHPARALAVLLRLPPLRYLQMEPLETADAELLQAAAEIARLRTRRKETMEAAIVRTGGSFADFLTNGKSSARKSFNRSERMLAKLNAHGLRSDKDGAAAREAFAELSKFSWKGSTGTGLGASSEGRKFLQKLSERLGDLVCSFSVVMDGTTPVAGRHTLVYGGVHYGVANDFNENYAKIGVGRNSMMHWVQDACDDNASHLDLMRTSTLNKVVATNHRVLEQVLLWRRYDPIIIGRYLANGTRAVRRKLKGWEKGRAGTKYAVTKGQS